MKRTLTAKSPKFTYNPNSYKIYSFKIYRNKAEYITEKIRRSEAERMLRERLTA